MLRLLTMGILQDPCSHSRCMAAGLHAHNFTSAQRIAADPRQHSQSFLVSSLVGTHNLNFVCSKTFSLGTYRTENIVSNSSSIVVFVSITADTCLSSRYLVAAASSGIHVRILTRGMSQFLIECLR
jgi:hypothetical protein